MFVKGKIKRSPGRTWGSTSKNKFGGGSTSFKSWNTSSKVAYKGKPPGRPWHSNTLTKVCLLCLHQYNQSEIDSETSDEEEDEQDDEDCAKGGDPLSNNRVADFALDMLNSSKLTRGVEKVVIPKKRKVSLYVRFLTILGRHLKMNTKRFRNSALRNQLSAPFCEKCSKTVKQLCKVYEEWNNAKLGLEWKLRQISDSIKVSKVSVSGKLHCTLLKSLSTQLRVMSSQAVDVFRKQMSILCSAKLVNQAPRVALNKNSCINAVKANWKWKFAYDQMKQYLQSLIVVFSLAVPQKELPAKKCVSIAGPKSKTRKVCFGDGKRVQIKQEGGAEAKKENVPPRGILVKREPGQGCDNDGADDDDDHFVGGDHSPPGSVGGGGNEEEDEGNKNDSDWSAGAPSGNDSAGSDVEFSVNTNTIRRWNLRRRKTRSKSGGAGGDDGNDSDADYVPGTLPPLRSPRKKREVDESEKKFSCNLCSQKFGLERGLKRHLSQAHAFLMIYTCPKCPNLRFKKSKELDAHRKKVHRFIGKPGDQLPYMGRPTACTICEKMFPSKMKMMIHRKTTHKVMTTMQTCELCGKKVRGQVRMEFHMKTHTRPDKSHRCTKCPRGFNTEVGLNVHMKLHEDNPDWVPWTRIKTKKNGDGREGAFRFTCDIEGCGKVFYKSANLTIHKSLHSTQLKCDICQFSCNLTRDFRRHLNQKHETEEQKYFCLHCDKAFTLEQTYDLHKKIAHPTKAMLGCDVDECTEEFETTEQLRQHLKTMHLPPDVEETKENFKFYDVYGKDKAGEKKILPAASEPVPPPQETTAAADVSSAVQETATTTPSSSGETTTATGESQQQCKTENQQNNMFEDLIVVNTDSKNSGEILPDPPRLYTCARCDWSFSRKICYSLHLILHTSRNEKRTYACDLCGKDFSVVDSLQTHYNSIHGPKIKPYCCLICGVRFHRKESFIPHMRIHRDKGSNDVFECDQCDRRFHDSVNLNKHKRMSHQKEPYFKECEECKERFPSKLALLTHKVDVHGMEKPFKCPADGCGKGFFFQTQLTDHRICHIEPTFACHLCPKKFKRQHNLSDHILVHKQEKNHFCEYCGRAFVKKSSLNLHLDIHRGIKKYKCDYCGKAFCRKFARDCHLRVHTKEKPFKCDICGVDFAQYSALKMHLKVHEKHNSDKVIRVPFKKSLAVGKPLRSRKGKKKNAEEGTNNSEEAVVQQQQPGPSASSDPSAPTSSGILHEAMKAAFDDIHMELEMGGLMKEEEESAQTQQQIFNAPGVGVQVINETNAVTAATALEQSLPNIKEDDSEDEKVQNPPKSKRGRRPKIKKKSYSCGFCGKLFLREDFYNKHVERHMKEVDAESAHSIGDSSQQSYQSSLMESQNSLQEVLLDEPHSLRRRSTTFEVPATTTLTSSINVPTPPQQHQQQIYQSPPPPPAAPVLAQPIVEEQPRRRGRPPKNSGGAPGSRLARIVEDVLETAINRPGSVLARQPQQQHQFPHQQPQQFHSPSPHHVQTPSPHHIAHSGSERSTPTGSPAPIHHHQQQQQQNSTTVTNTTSAPSLTFPTSTAASILSPFLFSNPYLIPRVADQQQQQGMQQDALFAGFQNRQSQQNAFSQHTLPPQTLVSYPQQQFHQSSIQASSQGSARTMPQDLSKNNYSLFYNNNQR